MLELLEEVDMSDQSQAQAARDAVGEMLKPPDDSLSQIPTRPPNKNASSSGEFDEEESDADAGIGGKLCDCKPCGSSTTFKFMLFISDLGSAALKQIGLQKVISSMLDVKDFGHIMDASLVEPRLSLSVIASQLLSGSDEVRGQSFPDSKASNAST